MRKFVIPNIEEESTVTRTIRIKRVLINKLETLAIDNNISLNRLVNECIEYALENMEEETTDNKLETR